MSDALGGGRSSTVATSDRGKPTRDTRSGRRSRAKRGKSAVFSDTWPRPTLFGHSVRRLPITPHALAVAPTRLALRRRPAIREAVGPRPRSSQPALTPLASAICSAAGRPDGPSSAPATPTCSGIRSRRGAGGAAMPLNSRQLAEMVERAKDTRRRPRQAVPAAQVASST